MTSYEGLRRVATLSSLILRLSAYIFLRWLFYNQYVIFTVAWAVYAVVWYRFDRLLFDLESSPRRTMVKQERTSRILLKEEADGSQEPNSPEISLGNGHADVPLYLDRRTESLPPRASLSAILIGSLTSSRVFNRANFVINTLLLFMSFDCLLGLHVNPIYGATSLTYVRVGGVGPDWARLSARVPIEEGARLIYRPTQPLGSWIVGPLLQATNETDYTTVAVINGLDAASNYEYRLARADSPMSIHPLFPSSQRFKTFPDPRLQNPSHFSFASTSCIKPGFPYSPLRSKFTISGASYLAQAAKERSLDFILFLGDFIYSDRPYWPGPDLDSYWKRFRQVYASPQWREVTTHTPTMHIYDDHEFINDYAGQDNDSAPIFSHASRAYRDYQGVANPPPVHPGVNYYSFRHGDTAFFVLDTRRYRSLNSLPDDENKTMLGSRQKQDFLRWLSQVNSTTVFKFVVSSIPMTKLWERADTYIPPSDTWSSFLTERDELLDVMQFVPNLIVISGDKHEFAAASLRNTVTEFSVSPLSQFYIPLQSLSDATADGQDVALKYISAGSSKFAIFEVDTRVVNEPRVHVDVIVDGASAWKVTILGKPVSARGRAVGKLLPDLMELLGFGGLRRRRWF